MHTGLTDGTVTEVLDGVDLNDEAIVDLEGGDGAPASPAPRSTSFRPMF